MSKPQEILELEEVYGITLTELKDEDMFDPGYENTYQLNDQSEVTGINLDNNEIKEIKGFEKFHKLDTLSLYNTNISEIKNLEKLTKLTQLDISHNQISKIENLDQLTNLFKLHIYNNQITKIENLDKLTNIQELYISDNKITKIENLEKLTNIQKLNIYGNQISELKNLDKLTNLQELGISHNQITKIENLEKLTNIQELNISNNQILEIKNLDKLTNLQGLYISNNQISKIDYLKQVLHLPVLNYLSIDNNPFIHDQNLVLNKGENHLDIIKSELQKLEEVKISIQLPVKVMLLGNHASGKSTLLTYLQTQECSKVDKNKNSSTHVLSVVDSEEKINHDLPKAIFYDFGGQDYYHGVYQAFFTNESVNLLVWNPKNDANELLESDSNKLPTRDYNRMYWLAQLQYSFLKRFDTLKNYNDPLLLIQTHADENNAKQNWNEAFDKNHVVDEFHISLNADSETTRNTAALQYLTATFWDVVENHSSEKKVPEWYPKFLSYIINKKNTNAISLDTITDYYEREDLSKKEKRTFLQEDLEQLARKGLLLYYKNDEELNDVAWLNPSATVAYIHDKILSKDSIKKFKGRLPQSEFKKRGVSAKIERLLLNEKVLFFDKGNNEYIIPNYLPLTSEGDEVYDLLKFDFNKPTFVLKFERFIPFGLINQLICHYGQNPDKKHYWRDQLIFTIDKRFKVWIQLDFSKLTISVSIKPQTPKDPELNACIREVFTGIILLYWGKEVPRFRYKETEEKTFEEIENEQLLGKGIRDKVTKIESFKTIFQNTLKPEDLYLSTDGEHFVHYNTLDDPSTTQESILSFPMHENDLDKTAGRIQRSYKYRNFTDNENIKKMKKIFISYSRKDVEYKDELRKHLNMLKLFDVADNWSCEDITIGKWHDQIQKELEESDLVIFMLSINFFNSRYIIENEVLKTMNTIANGSNKKVYCIIVSEFPRLEKFDKEGLSESQNSILQLGDYQFGSYVQERNELTENKEERIISLKEAKRKGILDIQLTQIAEKILDDIK